MPNNCSLARTPNCLPSGLTDERFQVVGQDSLSRTLLENQVRHGFGTHFGACVEGFMPMLLRFQAKVGTGIIGYRSAAEELLYVENYLEFPIDVTLSNLAGGPVSRRDIIEVGQFVADDRRVAGEMFQALAKYLHESGYNWVTCTATGKIRSLLSQVGFEGLAIAVAHEDAVRDSSETWGNYYSNDPIVIAGKLSDPYGDWCAKYEKMAVAGLHADRTA